jgi:hypothetical protein
MGSTLIHRRLVALRALSGVKSWAKRALMQRIKWIVIRSSLVGAGSSAGAAMIPSAFEQPRARAIRRASPPRLASD